jgi:microcystin degradation protein MlrC
MKVRDAVLAGIADRPGTEACYQAGVGATLTLTVGASLDPQASKPVEVTGKVRVLAKADRLPDRQAVVEADGVTFVLTARRRPFHEISDFTSLGLDPTKFRIVVVKAGYLVPAIAEIANPNLMALTEGAVNQDIPRLSNRHRVPTYPWVPDLKWTPTTIVSARSGR